MNTGDTKQLEERQEPTPRVRDAFMAMLEREIEADSESAAFNDFIAGPSRARRGSAILATAEASAG